jgi:hypothetical protein
MDAIDPQGKIPPLLPPTERTLISDQVRDKSSHGGNLPFLGGQRKGPPPEEEVQEEPEKNKHRIDILV